MVNTTHVVQSIISNETPMVPFSCSVAPNGDIYLRTIRSSMYLIQNRPPSIPSSSREFNSATTNSSIDQQSLTSATPPPLPIRLLTKETI